MSTIIEEVVGPPGTGKTTYLANETRKALTESKRVAIVSLTKTAAQAVLSKNLQIGTGDLYGDQLFVGTLHKSAWLALGSPPLAAKYLDKFNQEYPSYATQSVGDIEEPFFYEAGREDVIAEYNRLRATGVPLDAMPLGVQNGARVYEDWKRNNSEDGAGALLDFQDVIELATESCDSMPGDPEVIYLDETQDFSTAEVRLAHRWSQRAGRCVAVGDPDQCIFEWRGATPDALERVGAERVGILEQSYRLPRAVHHYSQDLIRKVSKRRPAPFTPREADGVMRYLPTASPEYPAPIVEEISANLDAMRFNDRFKPATYMILTTCGYQLEQVTQQLRANGVPFFNPYRPRKGHWNPIQRRRGTVSYLERLAAFGYVWRGEYVRKWVAMVLLDRVFKKPHPSRDWLKTAQFASEADFLQSLTDEARNAWNARDYDWLESVLSAQWKGRDSYARTVLERRGVTEAEQRPRVIIGTIHSVKGGEADVVYVMPQLSATALAGYETSQKARDAVLRAWYVGFTRAREELVVCGVGKK